MMIFLFKLLNFVGLIKHSKFQIITKMTIKTIGINIVKNALNISFDGAKDLISVSSINQSKDKKASDGEPTILSEPKISIKPFGNFRSNE